MKEIQLTSLKLSEMNFAAIIEFEVLIGYKVLITDLKHTVSLLR